MLTQSPNQQQISTIFSHVATQLRSLSDQASKPILYTTSLLMQSCPVEVWTPTMEQSGIFTVLAGRTLQEVSASKKEASPVCILGSVDGPQVRACVCQGSTTS